MSNSTYKHQYLVLFRGDDSDFTGNQKILLKLETELDLTGCKAHFRFLDFNQDFNEIPADKTLELVFPKASTANFPLGAMDAELWLEDSTGKRRTVANRIHIVVTLSVDAAYDNDDPQAITVVITSGSAESVSWNNVTGKPSTFPPSAHTHPISQVDGLQAELNQKVNKIQNATAGNLASLTSDGEIQNSGESVASLKEYTNTQVATNTANFLGTYDYATDLGFTPPATSADVDNDEIAAALATHVANPSNNDYVFVVINYTATTPADEFRRFKYNSDDEEWLYEYTLNSASFTTAQWAAINSGITGVVAPSTTATVGQAASAKATGDALAARPTKSQLDAGWWSEWTVLRNSVDVTAEVGQPRWNGNDWSAVLLPGETIDGAMEIGGHANSTELEWKSWEGDEEPELVYKNSYIATRRRVAAPVPTKPSDIGAASVADATLTPQLDTVWKFSGAAAPSGYHWGVEYIDSMGDAGWRLFSVSDSDSFDSSVEEVSYSPENATTLTFSTAGVTATRSVIGYTLGSQSTKPLQPKGDYAPATDIPKTALASNVQTSLGKADTAVQPAALAGKRGLDDFGVRGVPTGAGTYFVVDGVRLVFDGSVWNDNDHIVYEITPSSGSTFSMLDRASLETDSFHLGSDFTATVLGHTVVGYVDEIAKTSQLAAKAPLASPAFTGTPTAPTAASGDNSTRLATTAFVQDAIGSSSGNPLSGQSFDFATMQGVFVGVKACIEALGGSVTNFPANN